MKKIQVLNDFQHFLEVAAEEGFVVRTDLYTRKGYSIYIDVAGHQYAHPLGMAEGRIEYIDNMELIVLKGLRFTIHDHAHYWADVFSAILSERTNVMYEEAYNVIINGDNDGSLKENPEARVEKIWEEL